MSRSLSEAFWKQYHRRRSVNHASAIFCLRDCERLLARSNDPAVAGTLRRVRAALDDYEAIGKSLRDYVGAIPAGDAADAKEAA